jgi:ParB/RepB/Spo0J family partition protein
MKKPSSTPPVELISLPSIQNDSKTKISKKEIKSVVDGLEENGQLVPIIVTKTNNGEIHIVRGHAIFEAARELSWKQIKATVIPIGEDQDDDLTGEWIRLVEAHQRYELDDFALAKAAVMMEDKYKIRGSEFARQLGMSNGYAYNLMRWYRSAPDKVREAWRQGHPYINQAELERYSHMTKVEALEAWELRIRMRSSALEAFKPTRKNGDASPAPTPRRATEKQIAKLQVAIEQSSLTQPAKDLCTNILKFVLGVEKEVKGITDYQKLHLSLIEKDDSKNSREKEQRA